MARFLTVGLRLDAQFAYAGGITSCVQETAPAAPSAAMAEAKADVNSSPGKGGKGNKGKGGRGGFKGGKSGGRGGYKTGGGGYDYGQGLADYDPRPLLIQQIEYYFSIDNLCKDVFLRLHMDVDGWVPIQVSHLADCAHVVHKLLWIISCIDVRPRDFGSVRPRPTGSFHLRSVTGACEL
jgi:hypothetical protein